MSYAGLSVEDTYKICDIILGKKKASECSEAFLYANFCDNETYDKTNGECEKPHRGNTAV